MSRDEFIRLVDSMTPEAWGNMRQAVETGRWPDGSPLSGEQRRLCLQAIIAWEERHDVAAEQRTGPPPRPDCGSVAEDAQPVRLRAADGDRNA